MICDYNLAFIPASSTQGLTGTTATNSTNVFDAGSAKKLFGGSAGRGPKVVVTVTAVGGTSPTFRAQLVADSNANLATSPIVLADTGVSRVLTSADLPATFVLTPSDQLDAKEFYGLIFTLGGTSPTATVSTANVVMDEQSPRTGT